MVLSFKRFDGQLSAECAEPELFQSFIDANTEIAEFYETRDFGRAMRAISALADKANQYIDDKQPWVVAKQEGSEQQLHEICSVGINLFYAIAVYLKPVVPIMVEKAEQFLNVASQPWPDSLTPLVDHKINKFKPLMTRVDTDKLAAMIDASKDTLAPIKPVQAKKTANKQAN